MRVTDTIKPGPTPPAVRNAKRLIDAFGYWPSFHDAEVHRIELDRGGAGRAPSATCVIHVFDHDGTVDEKGYLQHRVSVVVALRFEDVKDFHLADFGKQNVINSLAIDPQAPDRHAVIFSPCYGIDCTFTCAAAEVLDVRPWPLPTDVPVAGTSSDLHADPASTDPRCSFCSNAASAVAAMITGPGVNICDECVDLCNAVIEEKSGVDPEPLETGALFNATAVCRLCQQPTDAADAVLVPTRGVLCSSCIDEIQKALGG